MQVGLEKPIKKVPQIGEIPSEYHLSGRLCVRREWVPGVPIDEDLSKDGLLKCTAWCEIHSPTDLTTVVHGYGKDQSEAIENLKSNCAKVPNKIRERLGLSLSKYDDYWGVRLTTHTLDANEKMIKVFDGNEACDGRSDSL